MCSFNIFSDNLKSIFKSSAGRNNDNIHESQDKIVSFQRALWRAVILQSILDLLNNSSRTENKMAKIQAKHWIFTNNEHFKDVCSMAGYQRDFVRKKILELMRKNIFCSFFKNKNRRGSKKTDLNEANKENKFFLIVNWHLNSGIVGK